MDSPQKLHTVLSLCTGYGGIERGLGLAGFAHRVVAHVEIEAFAAANLVAKMEAGQLVPAPIWTDLKTLPAHCFRERIDLLTGGYPCQPFSAAGLRRGAADPRHLWPHIRGHIESIRPVRCFFENVEGHISLGLREVIEDLESLGYATTWGVFSAAEVGAPHQRKRVYILGDTVRQRPSPEWDERWIEGRPWQPSEDVANAHGAGQQPSEGQPRSSEAWDDVGRGGAAMADANSQRQPGWSQSDGRQTGAGSEGFAATNVANANNSRLRQGDQEDAQLSPKFFDGSRSYDLADAISKGLERHPRHSVEGGQQGRQYAQPDRPVSQSDLQQRPEAISWATEPDVGRVVNGAAFRVDRLRLLGNGVVPQTAAKAWITLHQQLANQEPKL